MKNKLLSSLLFLGIIFSAGCKKKQAAVEPVPVNEKWWEERFSMLKEKVSAGDAGLVFIGDSITQGWEKAGKKTWSKYYSGRKALNLGIWGDRTQNVIWRLQNGNYEKIKPSLAVILIGTNNIDENSPAEIALGIKKILDIIAEKTPDTKILLLGILPRGIGFNRERVLIEQCNYEIKKFSDNKRIVFMNIGRNFLNKKGVVTRSIMFDYLHLTEKGYTIWAESIEGKVRELMD
jgi:lysophospholipase L1-like esterase